MHQQDKRKLSQKEFEVLSHLAVHGYDDFGKKQIRGGEAEQYNVEQTISLLQKKKYINGLCKVTQDGMNALEPYRVKNAVIMAAGLSSRFVPLAFEKPKGLLVVKNQVLIERQIEQLLEVGIREIYLVVGYMKELFFYLEEKYGVKIIINDEFAVRNNNGSLYLVREYLDNTYILSSDNYFLENVFEPYIYQSFYAVEYMEGESSERGVKLGKDGRIKKTFPNGTDCWVLLGHVYWNRTFSKEFIRCLESVYNQTETKPLLWERIFDRFLKQLPPLYARKYKNIIYEFDSLDELRQFDYKYVQNIESDIIENITEVLHCTAQELLRFEPMKNGQTNDTFTFYAGAEKYVYRHCTALTSVIVDRHRECEIQKIVEQLGLDHTCIELNPEYGWKISRFIEGTNIDFNNEEQLEVVIKLLHKLHYSDVKCKWRFDFRFEISNIHKLLNQISNNVHREIEQIREKISILLDKVEADNWPIVLCHNDINWDNFIVSDRIDLIDWEYAGMNDAAYDIAKLILKSEAKGDDAKRIIEKYYGRPCTPEEYRHIIACGAIEDYYWLIWALYLENSGRNLGSSVYTWHRHAVEYAKEALSLYEKTGSDGYGKE